MIYFYAPWCSDSQLLYRGSMALQFSLHFETVLVVISSSARSVLLWTGDTGSASIAPKNSPAAPDTLVYVCLTCLLHFDRFSCDIFKFTGLSFE